MGVRRVDGSSGFSPRTMVPEAETSLEKVRVTPELGSMINVVVAMREAVDGHVGSGVNFHGVLVKNGELEDRDRPQVDLLADARRRCRKPVELFIAVEMIS